MLLAVALLAGDGRRGRRGTGIERVAGSASGRELGLWAGVADRTDGVHRHIVRRATATRLRRRVAPDSTIVDVTHTRRVALGTSSRSEYQRLDRRRHRARRLPTGDSSLAVVGRTGPRAAERQRAPLPRLRVRCPARRVAGRTMIARTYCVSGRAGRPCGRLRAAAGRVVAHGAGALGGPGRARRSSSRGATSASSGRRNGSRPNTPAGSFWWRRSCWCRARW